MNNQEIVAKLWNLCNVLRDDGITYQQYVTELTYILFLKMCKETGTEGAIPEQYRWDKLISKQGVELKKFYKELLEHLGESCTAVSERSIRAHRVTSTSLRIWRRSSRPSISSTGIVQRKKDWAIFMKACWRRMRRKRSPAPDSISRLAFSSIS